MKSLLITLAHFGLGLFCQSCTSETNQHSDESRPELQNEIKLGYGSYWITNADIRAGKEQFVDITGSCQDSVKVFFPFGGTVSGATLFTDSTLNKKELRSVSYGMMDEDNFMTFTKSDLGRYFVNFGSCH